VTGVFTPNGSPDILQNVQYGYDALGNRRWIAGSYFNGDGSGFSMKWYTTIARTSHARRRHHTDFQHLVAGSGTVVTYDQLAGARPPCTPRHRTCARLVPGSFTTGLGRISQGPLHLQRSQLLTLDEQTIDRKNMVIDYHDPRRRIRLRSMRTERRTSPRRRGRTTPRAG